MRLKGLLQLQKACLNDNESVEMMPVDLLSKSILNLSLNPYGQAYNLHNAMRISWRNYLVHAIKRGYKIDFINQNQWHTIIKNIDEQNGLYKLSHVYTLQQNNEDVAEIELPSHHGLMVPSYEKMIDQQLTVLMENGFLPQPQLT